eukprot:gene14840-biopygen8133
MLCPVALPHLQTEAQLRALDEGPADADLVPHGPGEDRAHRQRGGRRSGNGRDQEKRKRTRSGRGPDAVRTINSKKETKRARTGRGPDAGSVVSPTGGNGHGRVPHDRNRRNGRAPDASAAVSPRARRTLRFGARGQRPQAAKCALKGVISSLRILRQGGGRGERGASGAIFHVCSPSLF